MTGTRDRAVGALLGGACGDALGRPVDGWSGAEVARRHGRVTEMRGGEDGRPAGATTDVTARALRVARVLAGDGDDDPDGGTGGAGDGAGGAASGPGRGAAVLVDGVPPGVAYRDAPDRLPSVVPALTADGDDERGTAATVALAAVVAGLVRGADATTALDGALDDAAARGAPAAVRTALATATDGTTASPGGGDAVGTLETALHDGLTASTAEEAVVAAVNRGGPASAAGAAAGALAGARFGAAALPDRWLDRVDGGPVREAADALLGGPPSGAPTR